MFDLAKLQAFVQATESPSFSEAARRLHLSQPTLSRHIQQLESELGAELFIRTGHELKLTEAGRLLLPLARKLIREAVEIQQLTGSFQDKIVGHIRSHAAQQPASTSCHSLPLVSGGGIQASGSPSWVARRNMSFPDSWKKKPIWAW
jgi:DNA-binding transcriptional LysR family regulator